ncbi:hypothetical protein K353_06136 [Kitasatospora sp. SolWspMP-SS2h]|nr:hypothetical protein K353_06136 [Kitasatospora sp. SolWspMP-SS2h]
MTAERTSNSIPKDMACPRCNAGVKARHVRTDTTPAGGRTETWAPMPCRNPQCSDSGSRIP